jgi:glycolate dehydrogenase iron-sulfur subunit
VSATAPASASTAGRAALGPGLASLASLQPLIDTCVHCGFCLPTCPSYLVLGQEMDSPRGRIYLMRAAIEQRTTLGGPMREHIDTCLGCLACVTACPSGVQYGPLIEATRSAIETQSSRTASDRFLRRLLFAVLPFPQRLRLVSWSMGLARIVQRRPTWMALLPPRLRALVALAPPAASSRDVAERTVATGTTRRHMGLVTGCVQRVFFGDVNEATVRVLTSEGCDVVAPSTQGCCGALSLHTGQIEDARRFARQLIEIFDRHPVDTIVTNAAGCGSTLKEYGHLLKDDPAWADRAQRFSAKVRDVTEVLAELPPVAPRHPLPLRIAYHDACHLAHGQGVRREPRAVLTAIPGTTIVPIPEGDICCGSAGVFNLLQPDMAGALGRRKAEQISSTGADIVVTSNPGCILQIHASQPPARSIPVRHIVEVVDASIRGIGTSGLTGRVHT